MPLQYLYAKIKSCKPRVPCKDAKNREIKELFALKSKEIYFKIFLKKLDQFFKKIASRSSQNPSPAFVFETDHVHRLIYRRTHKTSYPLYNVWCMKKILP